MNLKNLYDQYNKSPLSTQLALLGAGAIWGLVFLLLLGLAFFYLEERSQALEVTPVAQTPVIVLEPPTGSIGTEVNVQGEGWPANSSVRLFLVAPGESDIPGYAAANAVTSAEGQFTASFVFPEESRWDDKDRATVIARLEDGQSVVAQANFNLVQVTNQAEETPVLPPSPTETATVAPSPTIAVAITSSDSDTLPLPSTSTPTSTPVDNNFPEINPQPTAASAVPVVTAVTNLNVRSGPDTVYAIIGALQAGQSAEVTGLSYDGGWWQIQFPGVAEGRGWVAAPYVSAQNVNDIPLVQAPPAPLAPTPTPVPTPVSVAPAPVGVWQAEYYNNLNLSGTPVLVRNEADINFNWGKGSPAPGVAADNYSIRWSGVWFFNEGTYRFHTVVDDGVRLYVDNALVIDNWQDGGQRELVADRWLGAGNHTIRVEYYERTEYAVMRMWVEPLTLTPPPVASSDDDDDDDEPEADFSVNHRSGPAPLRVRFYNESDGDYDDCDWDFGDGEEGDDCDDFTHTYDHPGTYTVWLRVDGSDGSDTERKHDYIYVWDAGDGGGEPKPPVDWFGLLPPDWQSQVPPEYHGAVVACLTHFNDIQRPVSSHPSLNSILEDCQDYLEEVTDQPKEETDKPKVEVDKPKVEMDKSKAGTVKPSKGK